MLAFDKLRTQPRLKALALGGLACVLAGCGGSDSDQESTGGGMLQGSGSGSPTTGSGSPGTSSGSREEMGDCGVDGATVQLLSPAPGDDVGSVDVVGDQIIYGLASGMYRLPVGDSSATPEKFIDGDFEYSFLVGDRVGVFQTVDDRAQLTLTPLAGGAPTVLSLPEAEGGEWSYDAARNSLFTVAIERPFSYLRYDLGSGETEYFVTDLMPGSRMEFYDTPSALVVWSTNNQDDVDLMHRIDKGTTTVVPLDPGITDRFEPRGLDKDSIFLEMNMVDSGVPSGMYRMPLDGSAPAVRVEAFSGRPQLMSLYIRDEGNFGQDYDGRSYKVFPVDGPTAGVSLFEYGCGSSDGLAVDQNNLYLTVSPSEDAWLLTVPRP